MHMAIRVLVFAKDGREAGELAEGIAEGLCGGGPGEFDYYTMMGRPVRADGKRGKVLIEEGWEATEREFRENMARIRHGLAHLTDEELLHEVKNEGPPLEMEVQDMFTGQLTTVQETLPLDGGMVRHFMFKAGSYGGSAFWLYDQDGTAIRSPRHLGNVLDRWDSLYREKGGNPYDGKTLYVALADVHH